MDMGIDIDIGLQGSGVGVDGGQQIASPKEIVSLGLQPERVLFSDISSWITPSMKCQRKQDKRNCRTHL